MKNKKGEIATLLTLGLVVVGTLITLGTSLFVSNKKSNLVSNSRAACTSSYKSCTTVKSTYTIGGYYSSVGKFYKSANCVGEIVEGVGNYCKGLNPEGAPALPECEFKGTLLAGDSCDGSNNYTSVGCGKTSTGAQTYKCKPGFPAPATGGTSGIDCGMTVAFARSDCASGIDTTGCKSGTAKCKPLVAAPAGTVYNCSEHGGGTAYQGVGCYELCSKKGSKYVPNSQGTGTDGNNYCCCGGGLPGVDGYPADDSCWLVKCSGGEPTKMQYTDSLSKHDMPLSSCNDNMYSGGGKAAIGNANADAIFNTLSCSGSEETFTDPEPEVPDVPPVDDIPEDDPGAEADNCVKHIGFNCKSGGYPEKFFDYYKSTAKGCVGDVVGGYCYGTSKTSCSGEWNAFLKSQCSTTPIGPEPANTGTLKCANGSTARCTFGEGTSTTRGPGVCNGITEYIYGCSLAPANSQCSDFKDIYECNEARLNMCAWDGNKCIPKTPMGQTTADNNCETIYCSGGKTGQYSRGKPSTTYLFYKTPGECRDNIGAIASETTIKNAVCKSPIVQGGSQNNCDIEKLWTLCPNGTGIYYPNFATSKCSTALTPTAKCWGKTMGGPCNSTITEVVADFCNLNAAPATMLIAPPTLDLDSLGSGETFQFTIQTATEIQCEKPYLPTDLSCHNYGINYIPDITGLSNGQMPKCCVPLQVGDLLNP